MKIKLCLFLLGFTMISCAQVQKNEQIRIEEESNSDSIAFFRNKDALCLFYQKLDLLEQNQKRKNFCGNLSIKSKLKIVNFLYFA